MGVQNSRSFIHRGKLKRIRDRVLARTVSRWAGRSFLIWVVALMLQAVSGLAQGTGIKHARGQTAQIVAPMVSQAWNATVGLTTPAHQKQILFIGHYPGFAAAKKEANQRVISRMKSQSQSSTGQTFSLGLQAPTTSTVVFNGPAETDTGFIPPDSQIAAGPNYVVVVVNSLIAIYDKTGILQGSFQQLGSFFSSLSVTGDIFDPRIIYDQTDGRFILSADDVDTTNFSSGDVVLAVSATSDPTGVWYKYALNFMGRNPANTANTFPDFPVLGLSSTAVYLSSDQFVLNSQCVGDEPNSPCAFSDAWIKVVGLPELLSGGSTLNVTSFSDIKTSSGSTAFTIIPALTYGSTPQEFLVAADFSSDPSSELNVFSINTSGTPVLSEADLSVSPFSQPPDAIQGASSSTIATNDFRILNAVWINGNLWCGQNVANTSGTGVGAEWYEISASDLSTLSVTQSGIITGNQDAFYPAITADSSGDAIVVFSTSSQYDYVDAAFTGRSSSDPLGTMRTASVFQSGADYYSESRWGDYSGISLDPDDQSVWVIGEYADSPDPKFGTSIAKIGAPPSLNIFPPALNFDGVAVGSPSPPLQVKLTNISSNPVPISGASFSGPNASEFAISSDNCTGATLAAGANCTLSVSLDPAAGGVRIGALVIKYAAVGSPQSIIVQGTGFVQGVLSFSPSSLTFPDTPVQGKSAPQTVIATNTGSVDLTIQQMGIDPTNFTDIDNCVGTLAAGASCKATITFHPTSAGQHNVTLGAITTAPVQPTGLPVSGTGVAAPRAVLCPLKLSFGNQTLNTPSAPQTVTLTNGGSDSLNLTNLTVSGDFSQTNNCPGGLPSLQSCTVNVVFNPTATGSQSGSLTFFDDSTGSPQAVALDGTGVTTTAQMLPRQFRSQRSGVLNLDQNPRMARDIGGLNVARDKGLRVPGSLLSTRHPSLANGVYGSLPLAFEANAGQTNAIVKFLSRGRGYMMFLTAHGAVLRLEKGQKPESGSGTGRQEAKSAANRNQGRENSSLIASIIHMSLAGARADTRILGIDELPGKANYFISNDPSKWRTNVPLYAKVKYQDVYPGVNLVYYGNQRHLEYDFVVAPGADPEAIRFKIEVDGAVKPGRLEGKTDSFVRIARNGDLVIATGSGELRFRKPVVYQELGSSPASSDLAAATGNKTPGIRRPSGASTNHRNFINGRFVLRHGRPGSSDQVSFQLAPYDHSRALVIDPVLVYSTYLGGSFTDRANGIAVDSSGNVYLTGFTTSQDFPVTSGALDTQCGTDGDCDKQIPSDTSVGDAFVTKLSADGSHLVYSTFIGGSSLDEGNGIAVDSLGDAFVAGDTQSGDFPKTAGTIPSCQNATVCAQAFILKLNPTGSSLMYSRILAGESEDGANAVAVDSSGDAVITGLTQSTDFPVTQGVFQSTLAQTTPFSTLTVTPTDAFVAKVGPTGSLIFSTYLGGGRADQGNGVALDSAGNIYVVGTTSSVDFPTTPDVIQTGLKGQLAGDTAYGDPDAFVTKLSPDGSKLLYSTYLGGEFEDDGNGIAVDSQGNAYVTGTTYGAAEFPFTSSSLTVTPENEFGAFVTKLNPAGCALPYSSFIMLDPYGRAKAIAVDKSGDAYVAGTDDGSFYQVNSLQPSSGTGNVPFVAEVDPTGASFVFASPLGGYSSVPNTSESANAIALDPNGDIYVAGSTSTLDFPSLNALQPVCNNCFYNYNAPDAFVAKISPQAASSIFLTRMELDFPPQPLDGNGYTEGVGFMNNTSQTVTISSLSVDVPDYTVQGTPCSTPLAPGTGCSIMVSFKPTAEGSRPGTLTINDDGSGGPHHVALNGTGTADFSLFVGNATQSVPAGTNSVIVGDILVGSGSVTYPVTLSCVNVAPATCSFDNSSLTSANPRSRLTVSNLTAVTLDPFEFTLKGTSGSQYATVPITISFNGDFSISVTPTSATVTAGQAANYVLGMTPVNGFNQTVNFACSNLPANAQCSFSNTSLTPDGIHSLETTLTVSTTARSAVPGAYRVNGPRGLGTNDRKLPFGLLALLATLMLSLAASGRFAPVRYRKRAWVGFSAVVLLVVLWVSCGGGGGISSGGGSSGTGNNPPPQPTGTPAGTYTITVSGTSGSFSHSTTFKLTVQ